MKKPIQTMFYCGTAIDYAVFQSVHIRRPDIKIIAKKKSVQKELLDKFNVKSCLYPAFPDIVIMARHSARKFPEPKMKKIGMRHGAYHFKDFVTSRRYNAFDKYLVTSENEVRLGSKVGIKTAFPVGFPKLDPAFDGTITQKQLDDLKKSLNINRNKPTIIFTATWEGSRMSAVARWVEKLDQLTKDYNVLVTLHPWVSKDRYEIVKRTENVYLIESRDILPYLMISDVMIADMSSIIAEFCALNKPLITFKIYEGKRMCQEIVDMLEEISFRVDTFEELKEKLKLAVSNPNEHSQKREHYNKVMFDQLDGKASKRVVAVISEMEKDFK